jgi:excisionase family DNA binding protein
MEHVLPGIRLDQPPALRRWLSQQEAADYLGVTDRTIRAYIRSGALRARRMRGSRLVRIDRQEIDNALRPIPSAGRPS